MIAPIAWTPEQQIARMLLLCEAQMESALSESDVAVDELIKSFKGLIEAGQALGAQNDNTNLAQQLDALRQQTAAAVVAFQFYDKLTQRLGHVRYSLSTLALFVCDRNQTAQPEQWKRLLNTMRRLYKTEEERQIFQMIMDGIASDNPTPAPLAAEEAKAGEVELF